MAIAYFQVPVTVKPQDNGEASLVPPKALQGVEYRIIIVKDGAEEAIVRVEESETVLKKLEKEKGCNRLTARQLKVARKAYPPPKLKSKFRMRAPVPRRDALDPGAAGQDLYALDEQGTRILDTWQTVRSGFRLIDVPVSPEPEDA